MRSPIKILISILNPEIMLAWFPHLGSLVEEQYPLRLWLNGERDLRGLLTLVVEQLHEVYGLL
jgi:hypothetical protein